MITTTPSINTTSDLPALGVVLSVVPLSDYRRRFYDCGVDTLQYRYNTQYGMEDSNDRI